MEGGAAAEKPEQLSFTGFRLLLCYVHDFLAVTMLFEAIDTSGNHLIDRKEFQQAAPHFAAWGVTKKNAMEIFREIDSDRSGSINLDEFAAWAAAKRLEAEGDPDKA
ncbi:flagellar calcium-binding protein [Strigomonas culicis]|uniref:Flagellar calcium-binding protein n=1 Tax=Strigomonas culicis TaxID=28005 RepID=S9UBG4_9TRYP|nr:flagellar calcium-binding protein [Strigomonas culicis]|eukprot:EPY26064.1 flagellar calcium-binding protein [Strigomonas culicis]